MDEELREEIQELKEEIKALKKINQDMLTILYDRVHMVKLKEPARKDGEHNPRYVKEVKTKDLVKEYIENGYHITKAMRKHYKDTYGITYNCIRERLIKEGIWKDNRKSNTPDNTEGEISNE